MGWLWGGNGKAQGDATKRLDEDLRRFLDQETTKHDDSEARSTAQRSPAPPSPDAASNTFRSQLGLEQPGLDHKNHQASAPSDRVGVPPEALYQDGRYAHLWQSYTPQTEVESAGKSDQDRLADVIASFKDRKAEIGRTALENCADFQLAERECLTNGSWMKKMTMCREEGKAFNRCYTMQARFLSALGYLSTVRSEEEEERIAMHADKLYHEMLDREQLQKDAHEKGRELPDLPPLIAPDKITAALGEDSAFARARKLAIERGMPNNLSSYTREKQEEIKKRIAGLSPAEKEVELQLIAAESRSQLEYAEKIAVHMEEEKQHREERRKRGKETIGDTLRRLWGT